MHEVTVGDIITYEIHVGSCPNNIIGVDAVIYYDETALEPVDDSLKFPNLPGYYANSDLSGEIKFNAADLVGYEFQEDVILVTVEFKVIGDYNQYPNLSYEIKSFIDTEKIDHKGIYSYDLTYVGSYDTDSIEDVSESMVSSDVQSSTKEESSETDFGEISSLISENENILLSQVSSEAEEISSYSEESVSRSVDTVDTADTPTYNKSHSVIKLILIIAAAIILILTAVFLIIRGRSTGSHMSK